MNSLKTKMVAVFSVLIILMGGSIGFLVIQSSSKLVIQSISKQATKIGEYTLSQMDAEKYSVIIKDRKENDYFNQLQDKFEEISVANDLNYLYTMSREKTDNGYEYFYVITGDAVALGDIEENGAEYDKMVQTFETGQTSEPEISSDDFGNLLSIYIPIKDKSGEVISVLGVDYNATDIINLEKQNALEMVLLTGVFLIISIIIIFIFSKIVTKPLESLTKQAKKISEGDLNFQVKTEGKDEISALSRSFEKMVVDLREIIADINSTTVTMNDTTQELSQFVKTTEEASGNITQSMEETAIGIEKQSEEVNNILEMMSNMMTFLHEGVAQVKRTVENAKISTDTAQKGKESMREATVQLHELIKTVESATGTVQSLAKRSDEVGEIINVISDIANQTNLLALNAAIEAARAGENGKGFAVVADEVRKLAEQSQSAANKIIDLIESIQKETNETVVKMEQNLKAVQKQEQLIDQGDEALNVIVNMVGQTEKDTSQIEVVFNDLQKDSQKVLEALETISAVIEENTAVTEEVASASKDQSTVISRIVENVHKVEGISKVLKNKVDKFKI
ncbi:methyl-accepting chemotaxis protein [Solibacillus sp. MA9]|uniref:Methyl-accepting chemotaxis protein n=1 Tax=Solibacillus palustris TaxID=2908203 RepID=A0ABS9UAE2_9BACL|nr:methyl-accepting chemotaxis protein [Solibacillus sp. MA9]MCH7321289.1 methyl-accepting chemotaxis protein [Solibacillus sp. MA9]